MKRSEGSAQDEVKNCSYRSGAGFRFPEAKEADTVRQRRGNGAQLRSRGAHVTREPTNVTHSHVSLTSHRSP